MLYAISLNTNEHCGFEVKSKGVYAFIVCDWLSESEIEQLNVSRTEKRHVTLSYNLLKYRIDSHGKLPEHLFNKI